MLQTTEGGVLIRVDRLFCNWIGYAADQLVAPHGTTFSIVCPAA